MKRLLVLAGLVAAVGLTIAVVTGGASTTPGQTIHVIEHANTDTLADVDPPGDSTGDVLTFHNPVFNAADSQQVGRDQGYCIRIKASSTGSWECNFTTFLKNGHITVQGPFFDTKDSVLAITGGTGAYRDARGVMELRSKAGGTKFAFIFHFAG
jgi:allene oxide cyclase